MPYQKMEGDEIGVSDGPLIFRDRKLYQTDDIGTINLDWRPK